MEHNMRPHHQETITRVAEFFAGEPGVTALILGGSLAHGYAQDDSDVDVAIVVEASEFQERARSGWLTFFSRELCTYDGGYVDGKYVDHELLKHVAARGSDPARYAYKDCLLLFSRDTEIERLLREIARYPVEQKRERIERFCAQILAWRWFYGEAAKKHNQYLALLATQKLILFGSRIVLATNEMFYPYHKWLLEEVRRAENKPASFLEDVDALLAAHDLERIGAYCDTIMAFAGLEGDALHWPDQFMRDSELNWLTHDPPVDDL